MSDADDDYMNDNDDDEVIIGDDDSSPNFLGSPTNSDEIPKLISFSSFLQPQVDLISKELPNFKPYYNNTSTITFQVPANIIPSSLQMVCGFYFSPILIEVTLTFKNPSWTLPLSSFSATHPVFGQNYIGRPLIQETIRNFFTASYKPKPQYRCSQNLLPSLHLTYGTSPLLYLLLEIVDSFIDIQDHCCICHKPLHFSVIKPSICEKRLCEVSFNEIGVGTSVSQEIRRDVLAADLLLSIFACSTRDKRYMVPKPPNELMAKMYEIFQNLPSMRTISETCKNDSDIVKRWGKETLEFLRWIILSNRSQLISLPSELKLQKVSFPMQFMALIASPEAEVAFQNSKKPSRVRGERQDKKKKQQEKKKKSKAQNDHGGFEVNSYQSLFLWHGSAGDRWHSIVRNGLMNMSQKDCVNGASFGPGIYLAKSVQTSLSYVRLVKNLYKNSEIGPYMSLMALCEVVPNDRFNDFGSIATLQDEKAIIVRFVFPVAVSEYNAIRDDDDDYDDNYGYNGDDDDDNYDQSGYYYFQSNTLNITAGNITSNDIPTIDKVLKYLEKKNNQNKK